MNIKKFCTIISMLTASTFASADPNWIDSLNFVRGRDIIDDRTPPPGVILPPTNPSDLTAGVFNSARSRCWDSSFTSTAPVFVVRSDNPAEIPNSRGSDSDLNIFSARGDWQNPGQNCFTTPSQLAYIFSKNPQKYGSLAILLFANRNNCGGGNFWKGGKDTCAAHEETEIKNLWGIYPRIISVPGLARQNGCCVEYNTPLYDQACGPFTAVVACDQPMGSHTGTSDSNIIAYHGQHLRNYVKLDSPIPVHAIFIAAPDLRNHPSMSQEEYIQLIMDMNKVYMVALGKCKATTAISGPIGCGVFKNLIPVVCCTTACALRYHRPATLKNFVICGDWRFYGCLKEYYQKISTRFPDSEPTASDLLREFPEMFTTGDPACILRPAQAVLPVQQTIAVPQTPVRQTYTSPAVQQMPATQVVRRAQPATLEDIYKLFALKTPETHMPDLASARALLTNVIGAPDRCFASSCEAFRCLRVPGKTIMHEFAFHWELYLVLALTEWGYDINQLSDSGETPLDTYVIKSRCIARNNKAYDTLTGGLKALIAAGAKCTTPENCKRLHELIDAFYGVNFPRQKPLELAPPAKTARFSEFQRPPSMQWQHAESDSQRGSGQQWGFPSANPAPSTFQQSSMDFPSLMRTTPSFGTIQQNYPTVPRDSDPFGTRSVQQSPSQTWGFPSANPAPSTFQQSSMDFPSLMQTTPSFGTIQQNYPTVPRDVNSFGTYSVQQSPSQTWGFPSANPTPSIFQQSSMDFPSLMRTTPSFGTIQQNYPTVPRNSDPFGTRSVQQSPSQTWEFTSANSATSTFQQSSMDFPSLMRTTPSFGTVQRNYPNPSDITPPVPEDEEMTLWETGEYVRCFIPFGTPIPYYAKEMRQYHDGIQYGLICLIPREDPRRKDPSLTGKIKVYFYGFEHASYAQQVDGTKKEYFIPAPGDDSIPESDDDEF